MNGASDGSDTIDLGGEGDGRRPDDTRIAAPFAEPGQVSDE